MAKPKKYGKSPKAGASLTTWENYKKKCQDVDKYNASLSQDKKKKEAVKKSVQAIKSKR
ncbi:MAG: hypothetical protein ABIN80_28645 [Dyadobacter sp.]|uniref:hypothetical protein n=1 Tax=Dyadobacter sp. TaxID=1914288 RepID=UPI00326341DF